MSEFEYWKLCDRLTLVQAALLMAGHDPCGLEHNVEVMPPDDQPKGYIACRQALIGAIEEKRIRGWICIDECPNGFGNSDSRLNAEKSEVITGGIAPWLIEKGVRSNFFLNDTDAPEEFLDPNHERFAPKLAAAISAWKAVGAEKDPKGTPKQRIEKWLRLHAADYDLVQNDGRPNESAIMAISKIANWNLEGGAPVTPNVNVSGASKKADGSAKVIRLKKHAGAAAPNFEPDEDITF